MRELIDPGLPLEVLNGLGMVLSAIFEFLMIMYLVKESRRRKLPLRAWLFKLPPSMHLAVAIAVYVAGVLTRTATIWAWRRFFGAGEFSLEWMGVLTVGALLIVIGAVCKIRAISKPDWGNGPWLLSIAAVIGFVIADLYFR